MAAIRSSHRIHAGKSLEPFGCGKRKAGAGNSQGGCLAIAAPSEAKGVNAFNHLSLGGSGAKRIMQRTNSHYTEFQFFSAILTHWRLDGCPIGREASGHSWCSKAGSPTLLARDPRPQPPHQPDTMPVAPLQQPIKPSSAIAISE